MRNLYLALLLCLSPVIASVEANAARESRPIKIDGRVRTVMYQADAVYKFTGHYGFQSAIEFEEGETIATISMGDSTGWMINPLENRLFVKPVDQDATTNVTLITNLRTYLFEFHAREATAIDDPEMVFVMRFIYPDQKNSEFMTPARDKVPLEDALENPQNYNFAYTISGTDRLAPIRIFDDGEFTYFEFKDKNADLPAFFQVDSRGNESLINYRMRDNFVVVERVSARYSLRYGQEVICVYNETRDAAGNPKPPAIPQTPPQAGR